MKVKRGNTLNVIKLLFLSFVITIIIINVGSAQDSFNGNYSIGIMGGMNFSSTNDNLFVGTSLKSDYCFGLIISTHVEKLSHLQLSILKMNKGVKPRSNFGLEWNLDYIEISLLYKFYFISKGKILPSIIIGPYYGKLMNANIKSLMPEYKLDKAIKYFSDHDVGFNIGYTIEYIHFLSILNLVFDMRYSFGLSNIIENEMYFETLYEQKDIRLKNSNITIMLGLGINF